MTKHSSPARRILVVDDEPLVADAVKMLLEYDGHTVEMANSGEEGLTLFEKGKFDLVITDYEMPGIKGDQLALAIKARAPKQPVVLITAYAERLASNGNPLTGIDFVMSKPFRVDDLRAAIAKVLP